MFAVFEEETTENLRESPINLGNGSRSKVIEAV